MAGIQIFGTKKCRDSRRAQRFFKERGIPFQWLELTERPLSRGELESILRAAGPLEALLDEKNKNYCMIRYLTSAGQTEKLLEDSTYLKTPIVRCGAAAAVGVNEAFWRELAGRAKQ